MELLDMWNLLFEIMWKSLDRLLSIVLSWVLLTALFVSTHTLQLLCKVVKKDLTGKHVVVTGGSSGIGKSVALLAAKYGASVTIIARDQNKLNDVIKIIREQCQIPPSQKITALSMDVTQPFDRTDDIFGDLEESIGPIYMLVNCAGTAVCATIENDTESNFRKLVDLNFFGTVSTTKAVCKRMKQRGEGIIVITSSMASLLGIYGLGAYCASKWALRGFAETLYQEMLPHNVSVTVCLPPDTDTPGFENENIAKPEETKQICAASGLLQPGAVAEKLISDALSGRFWSTVGAVETLLCAGSASFGPGSNLMEDLFQIFAASVVRCIGLLNSKRMKSIILKLYNEKLAVESRKKAE